MAATLPGVCVMGLDAPLDEGTVLTVEPILTLGSPELPMGGDGCTALTADGGPTPHTGTRSSCRWAARLSSPRPGRWAA